MSVAHNLSYQTSSSLYGYQKYRFITRIRGGLVGFIYQQTLQMRTADLGDITAVALMGTDVERITAGLQQLHEMWASLLEIGIACWLLEGQLSLACIAPIVLVVGKLSFTGPPAPLGSPADFVIESSLQSPPESRSSSALRSAVGSKRYKSGFG